VVPRAGIEPAT